MVGIGGSGETDTSGFRTFDIADGIFGGTNVGRGRIEGVSGKYGSYGGQVGVCCIEKPQ